MPALAAIVYLLLCVRLSVRLEASVGSGEGSVSLSVGACGVYLRYDAVLACADRGLPLRVVPRYQQTEKSAHPARRRMRRLLRPYLRIVLRGGRFERIAAHVRLGLGDAGETAVGCGAAHALLCALFSPLGAGPACDLHVVPDFSGQCFCAYLQGIFSCQPGDIMLAALKDVLNKRKEGLKWKSIPLRA